MRRVSLLTAACAATALAGCAATYPTYVMAPRPAPTASSMAAYDGSAAPSSTGGAEQSDLSSVDQPRPRPRPRVASRATRSDAARATADATPSGHPRYSEEWWKAQDRLDDRTKRSMDICRGC